MDRLLLTLSASFGFLVCSVFAAIFSREVARVFAALCIGAICCSELLTAGSNRWNIGYLGFVPVEPSSAFGFYFGSVLLSLVAAFVPLRYEDPSKPRTYRLRWGLFVLVYVPMLLLVAYAAVEFIGYIGGHDKTRALLHGDKDVRLARFEIDNNQRRVICTDPEVLRYLESRMSQNERRYRESGIGYQMTVHYEGGGNHSFLADWTDHDVALYPEGGDGRVPNLILLPRPMSPRVEELIEFLMSELRISAGKVMILEPGGIRYERNERLIAR
jgi:hypothetical protein